jgi:hypothetical protein
MLEHEKLVTCSDSLGFIVKKFNAKDINEYYALGHAIEEFVISLVVEKNNRRGNHRSKGNCSRRSTAPHDIISGLVDKFQWFKALALSVPDAARSSLSHYKRMIEFIENKNTGGFKGIMRMHLDGARGRLMGLPGLLL